MGKITMTNKTEIANFLCFAYLASVWTLHLSRKRHFVQHSPWQFRQRSVTQGWASVMDHTSCITTGSAIQIVQGLEHVVYSVISTTLLLCNSNFFDQIQWMNFPEMQHKYCDICLEVEKKSRKTNCKQVVFSNYSLFAIVYNLVQFSQTLAWSGC